MAFASGGFLAFASVGEAIRKSIDAATEAAATERQLGAQFRANGQSLATYRQSIDEATLSTSKLSGFTRDDLKQSFLTAFRGSKDVGVGLKIQGEAADVARGRHMGLAQATLALTKAYGGQSTALRRLGILVPKGLSGMKALEFVQRRFAGQAKAGTTAQERFGAALQNTEVTIGTALLPSLNKYLNRATTWLDQEKNQQKIQRELNSAVQTGTGIIHGFGDVVSQARGPLKALTEALGGVRNSIRLLFEAFAAKKLVDLALGLAGVGTAASGAAIEVSALRLALMRLGAIGAIAVAIDLIINKKDRSKAEKFVEGKPGSQQNKSLHDLVHAGQAVADAATQIVKGNPFHSGHTLGFNESSRPSRPGPLEGATSGGAPPEARTQRQRQLAASRSAERMQTATGHRSTALGFKNRFAQQELKLAQAQLTTEQTDDRKVLVSEAQSIRERIKRIHGSQKHLAEETQLTQQLGSIEGQITQIDQQSLQSTTRWRRLELTLAQAQLTQTQTDDRKVLQAEAGVIRGRLASLAKTGKTLDERTALTQQLVGIEGQIQSIDQEALDKRKAAVAKHLQAVKQKEQELRQRIGEITSQFSQALDTARSGLGELFQGPIMAPTEAQMKAKLGAGGADVKTLTRDLNAQVAQFARFQHDLAVLAKRGAPKQLLKELRAKGTEALPEIEALAKSSTKDLKAFFKAFGKGERLVQKVARIDMKAALVTLRADKLQLLGLRHHQERSARRADGGVVRRAKGGVIPAAGFKGYAKGGLVGGSGRGDSVPAMLTPGEMVLNRGQQNMLGGQGALAKMFGFAGGGVAGDPHHISKGAQGSVKWNDAAHRFRLVTMSGDKGIATVRMQRGWFNDWVGQGVTRAHIAQVIPWWEREGFFEQRRDRRAVRGHATGGVAHGEAGVDRIPVLLTKGEVVFNNDQQARLKQALGVSGGPQQLFEHVRRRLPRFASGGVAGESFAAAAPNAQPVMPLPRGLKLPAIGSEAVLRKIAGLLSEILATLKGQPAKTQDAPGLSHVLHERVRVSAISKEIRSRTIQASLPVLVKAAMSHVVMPRQQLPRAADAMLISARDTNRPQEFNLFIDGQPVEATVTARQQRKAKTMAPQVRGRHPGHVLGTS